MHAGPDRTAPAVPRLRQPDGGARRVLRADGLARSQPGDDLRRVHRLRVAAVHDHGAARRPRPPPAHGRGPAHRPLAARGVVADARPRAAGLRARRPGGHPGRQPRPGPRAERRVPVPGGARPRRPVPRRRQRRRGVGGHQLRRRRPVARPRRRRRPARRAALAHRRRAAARRGPHRGAARGVDVDPPRRRHRRRAAAPRGQCAPCSASPSSTPIPRWPTAATGCPLEHPVYGAGPVLGDAGRPCRAPRDGCAAPAPCLGQDTWYVLETILGFDGDTIAELLADDVAEITG